MKRRNVICPHVSLFANLITVMRLSEKREKRRQERKKKEEREKKGMKEEETEEQMKLSTFCDSIGSDSDCR